MGNELIYGDAFAMVVSNNAGPIIMIFFHSTQPSALPPLFPPPLAFPATMGAAFILTRGVMAGMIAMTTVMKATVDVRITSF